jgi:hypothetical protein
MTNQPTADDDYDVICSHDEMNRDTIARMERNALKMQALHSDVEREQFVADLCSQYELVFAIWDGEVRDGEDGYGVELVKGGALLDKDPYRDFTFTAFSCRDREHANELQARFGGRPQ